MTLEREYSHNWVEITSQCPELIQLFGCTSDSVPTLDQINILLSCFCLTKEPTLHHAFYSLIGLLGQSVLDQPTGTFRKSIDYFDLLPNEILCNIFRWVLLDARWGEITSYQLVSKRVYYKRSLQTDRERIGI